MTLYVEPFPKLDFDFTFDRLISTPFVSIDLPCTQCEEEAENEELRAMHVSAFQCFSLLHQLDNQIC